MKLRVHDQMHVSAVQSEPLRAGQEIDVSDDLGAELLARHPGNFAQVGGKSAPKPKNKALPAPPNKAAPRRRAKAK